MRQWSGIERGRRSALGFTMIELGVALTVLGVLLAIVVPTYLGTRAGAQDSAAKSATLAGVKTASATDRPITVEAVRRAEPGLKIEELPVGGSDEAVPEDLGNVYVRAEPAVLVVVSRSASGRCFWARDADTVVTYATNHCTEEPEFTTSW